MMYPAIQVEAFNVAIAGTVLGIVFLIPLIIKLVLRERKKPRLARRIMIHMFTAYLGFAIVILGGAIHGALGKPLDSPPSLCVAQGWMVVYWDQALNFWVLILALDIYLNVIHFKDLSQYEKIFSILGWGYPVIPAMISLGVFGFIPAGTWCFIPSKGRGTYVTAVLPLHHDFLAVVCVAILCMYARVVFNLVRHSRRFKTSTVKSSTLSLVAYPFVHLVVEIPTLVRRGWESSHGTNNNLLMMQTVLIAFEGFFNVVVYAIRRGYLTRVKKLVSTKLSVRVAKPAGTRDSTGDSSQPAVINETPSTSQGSPIPAQHPLVDRTNSDLIV